MSAINIHLEVFVNKCIEIKGEIVSWRTT